MQRMKKDGWGGVEGDDVFLSNNVLIYAGT